ncbi:MAG: phosphoribosylformylglycinamidine cyclo-ligase [Acidobacteria bacterium]|nr:phosphoribosylformylglycinamidine cyclo-ligase [Acidobacteriota bacterium]
MTPVTYKDAGVDIDAGNAAKRKIRDLVRETFTPQVLGEIGGFGSLYRAEFSGMKEPVLVSSADGVGTKLKVAFQAGRHNTVGYDLVCHSVNDVLVQGARPLFFLDYLALSRVDPEVVGAIVEGMVRACKENGCALIGGETAEMPGFYADGEYDVAGFIVGVVDREKLIDGRSISPGDTVLGLPSVGLHTNGYSLARRLLLERAGYSLDTILPELGCSVGEELLKPHRSYLSALSGLVDGGRIKGLAHITGGGLLENLPRILPEHCEVEIDLGSWPVLPVFRLLIRLGGLPDEEAYRVLNMGIGMTIICRPGEEADIRQHLEATGESPYRIGRVVEGARGVRLRIP